MPPKAKHIAAAGGASLAMLASWLQAGMKVEAPCTLAERLAMFPRKLMGLEGPVTVRWNAHQVPYIIAEQDGDLPIALGAVTAHLRLGQLESLRRIATGRLSEIVGRVALEVDAALRVLDVGHAARAMEFDLPPATRAWVTRYVDGLNSAMRGRRRRPPELKLLRLRIEPWTVRDVLTIGRLISADVNWLGYLRYLSCPDRKAADQIWDLLHRGGTPSLATYGDDGRLDALAGLLLQAQDSGSNAVVVSGRHTPSGAPLLANDPHLGLGLPNFWMLAGLKSPGFHAVGLVIPGLPFVAVGRNRDLAWGGTNMRALSTDLVDVSGMPPDAFRRRTERIRVRWGRARTFELTTTPHGPLLTDVPMLKGRPKVAFKWVGHRPSDELTAFLGANRARSAAEFREAFAPYAVSGMNLLYADRSGTIGCLPAVTTPDRRDDDGRPAVITPEHAARVWAELRGPLTLPWEENPKEGFFVSANNRPFAGDPLVSYAFASNDRIGRLKVRLGGAVAHGGRITEALLLDLQKDVYLETSFKLARLIAAAGGAETDGEAARRLMAIAAWDGCYDADSIGAARFEEVLYVLAQDVFTSRWDPEVAHAVLGSERAKALALRCLEELDPDARATAVKRALAVAAAQGSTDRRWGDLHRLRLRHSLGNAPLIGGQLASWEHAAPGSAETLLKMAHPLAPGARDITYGQNARFITDLADPDGTKAVLLGGQDGWLGSDTFFDQADLWRADQFVALPMTMERVEDEFPLAVRVTA